MAGERFLQVILGVVLLLVGVQALLTIRAHYIVWRYSPQAERLPRPPQA